MGLRNELTSLAATDATVFHRLYFSWEEIPLHDVVFGFCILRTFFPLRDFFRVFAFLRDTPLLFPFSRDIHFCEQLIKRFT
jgi:hypothetical protein